jgi:hypothetical protein
VKQKSLSVKPDPKGKARPKKGIAANCILFLSQESFCLLIQTSSPALDKVLFGSGMQVYESHKPTVYLAGI